MSADGKIYIYITDELLENRIKGTKEAAPEKHKKSYEEKKNDFIQHQMFHLIESEAKQMANYTLGNIGNFTGDYNAQRQINTAMSVVNVASNIFMGAVAGSKFGFPGALVGASVAAISQGVNFGLQLNSQNLEIRRQNYNVTQLRQLSGLDGLTNGSRI